MTQVAEEGWAAIPLDGGLMEKINLPFFYQLGYWLHPIVAWRVEPASRLQLYFQASNAAAWVRNLLDSFSALTICRPKGDELLAAIDNVANWGRNTQNVAQQQQQDPSVDWMFYQVTNRAREFETVLTAELQSLATYHVTQKGIYSTTDLIERADKHLPESIHSELKSLIAEEIRQSGKCLAYDCPTASGFHILRAVEAITYDYYIAICKPKAKGKLDSWGAYIKEFRDSQDTSAKRVAELLQQVKDHDRNLIMHPELSLTPDEAYILFEIGHSVIMAMVEELLKKKTHAAKAKKQGIT